MSRLTSLALLTAPVVLSFATSALAQSQAEIAEKLNEEGKELMYANKYPEATAKFRQAVARVTEPKYFFNLCVSLTNEGNLVEARANCYTAKNNGNGEVVGKADKMMAKIEEMAKQQGTELPPLGGGQGPVTTDPNHPANPNGDPNHQAPPPRVGTAEDPQHPMTAPPIRYQAPEQNLVRASTPDNKYTWTLGVDVFGGGGQIGQKDAYGSAAGGFRLKSDYMFDPVHKFGGEGYLQYQHLGQGKNDSLSADQLDIIDVGVAAYKHFCLGNTPRLCLTPLIGVHVALMSPAGETDSEGSQLFNYAAVGGRAEVALSYAFGPRYEHVLSLAGGANFYSQVLSDSADYAAADVGLDKGGALGYISLGYTRRFNTPLGSSPFITLE